MFKIRKFKAFPLVSFLTPYKLYKPKKSRSKNKNFTTKYKEQDYVSKNKYGYWLYDNVSGNEQFSTWDLSIQNLDVGNMSEEQRKKYW